jgi:hypothetical protein
MIANNSLAILAPRANLVTCSTVQVPFSTIGCQPGAVCKENPHGARHSVRFTSQANLNLPSNQSLLGFGAGVMILPDITGTFVRKSGSTP